MKLQKPLTVPVVALYLHDAYRLAYGLNALGGPMESAPCRAAFQTAFEILRLTFEDRVAHLVHDAVLRSDEYDQRTLERLIKDALDTIFSEDDEMKGGAR